MAQRAGRFLISSPEDYLKSLKSFCASIEQEGDPNNCVEEHVSALIGDFVSDLLNDHSPFRILGVGSGEGAKSAGKELTSVNSFNVPSNQTETR